MSVEQIKKIFKQENNIAFLIGNGINRYFNTDTSGSWHELLLGLWQKFVGNPKQTIPEGILTTEFYDILLLKINEKQIDSKININTIQSSIKKEMEKWNPNPKEKNLLQRIQQMNSPILTLNFDDLMKKSLKLRFFKMKKKEGFTDFYPWECYFSENELQNPTEGFGIWHINGMIKYHRSIKLGLSQYMDNVYRARKFINQNHEKIFNHSQSEPWKGYYTWLHIFFHKSLFIFGCSLDESEIFVRWLLIERAKLMKKLNKKNKMWFVHVKKGDNLKPGKKFFFNSVGIEIIELNSYQELYEEIWQEKKG